LAPGGRSTNRTSDKIGSAELRFVFRQDVAHENMLAQGKKMGAPSNDWKTQEAVLLTYCYNLDCLKPFHVTPSSEAQVEFFNELLVDRNARGPAKLLLICPRCGAFVEVLTSQLEVCTCGQEPHNPPYKP
jgi:hypothetical protein